VREQVGVHVEGRVDDAAVAADGEEVGGRDGGGVGGGGGATGVVFVRWVVGAPGEEFFDAPGWTVADDAGGEEGGEGHGGVVCGRWGVSFFVAERGAGFQVVR